MQGILTYAGEYGRFSVNVRSHEVLDDSLKRGAIWDAAGQNYHEQMVLYSEIADGLLESGDQPPAFYAPVPPSQTGDSWGGEELDFGFRIFLRDGWRLDIEADPNGTYFIDPWPEENESAWDAATTARI